MPTAFVVGGLMALSLALGGTAQAQSSCDAGVTKALAKKVSCKLTVFAVAQRRGTAADGAKLTRCEGKFAATCVKAQSKNDCQARTSSCAALEAVADAAVDDLRGAPPTSTTTTTTTTTTLDPLRPCGEDPDGMCGGVCERGECVREGLTATCVCFRPCGRDPNGTCGGICDFYPFEECVQDDQTGDCVCFLPCQAIGGIGSCQGTCSDPRAVCTFAPPPLPPCSCIIPCAGSGAPPCDPPCGPSQGCIFNPNTSACECVP